MSNARETVIHRIRHGLRRGPLSEAQRAALAQRLAQPPSHPIPARACGDAAQLRERFISMAREASASLQEVGEIRAAPGALARWLGENALPMQAVVAPNEVLTALPWEDAGIGVEARAGRDGDRVTISLAYAGVAETGTLALLSGADSPTTLNFLPDVHVVVLSAQRIVGPYEAVWQRMREEGRALPRCLNLITGPSRSADIEQRLQMGAHGPIQLHILLVD